MLNQNEEKLISEFEAMLDQEAKEKEARENKLLSTLEDMINGVY